MQKLTDNATKVLALELGRIQRLQAHDRRASAVAAAPSRLYPITGNAVPIVNFLVRFSGDETGVTVIEYGLIAALISVVCIVGMTLVGGQLQGVYNAVSAAITPAL